MKKVKLTNRAFNKLVEDEGNKITFFGSKLSEIKKDSRVGWWSIGSTYLRGINNKCYAILKGVNGSNNCLVNFEYENGDRLLSKWEEEEIFGELE